ncbi:MAG TPA: ubiquitin-conjugating enzyme E2 [Tepidisphaeraceae bacterium]|jgi:ubiquitin-protein ligase
MIAFACPSCGKSFSVPDSYAGRRARCKGCREELTVPAVVTPAAPAKPPLRVRRLLADAASVREAFAQHPRIKLASAEGDPPDTFVFEFNVSGLERDAKGKIVPRQTHRAEVKLGADYPRLPPVCRMLTPVFHPNIDAAHVCIGDHWTAGERLIDLVTRLGEMLAYQAYNIRSPLDGEAAMWADLNAEKLPTDPRPIQA